MVTRPTRGIAVVGAMALAVALALAGCGGGNRYVEPPPPTVTVAKPLVREVTTFAEFTGRTTAVETADLRARVQGFLRGINFDPGSDVREGQLLFVIEPDLYQARLDQAEAALQGSEAQARAAEDQLAITQAIFQRSAGSRADLVQKLEARDQANAAVATARANLAQAKLDLSYTRIYAPFDGRIDRNRVDVGNLVGVGEATLLATLVRSAPIYAYFTASEREFLRFQAAQRAQRTVAPTGEHAAAYLGLATEEGYPHVGKVDYVSNRVDPNTGTIEVRAIFPNTERILIPGLFGRIRLPNTREQALLVPDGAMEADQGGPYLLVVGDDGVVQYRRVSLGQTVGTLRIVFSGITADDWVVVDGVQRARPGATVQAKRSELPEPPPQDPTRP